MSLICFEFVKPKSKLICFCLRLMFGKIMFSLGENHLIFGCLWTSAQVCFHPVKQGPLIICYISVSHVCHSVQHIVHNHDYLYIQLFLRRRVTNESKRFHPYYFPIYINPIFLEMQSSLIKRSRKKFKSAGFPLLPQWIDTGNGLQSFEFSTQREMGQKTVVALLQRGVHQY